MSGSYFVCGTCKYWQETTNTVFNHGSCIYGICLNHDKKEIVLKEFDDSCIKHEMLPSAAEINTMEKQAVVKDEEPVSPIVKEAMEKLIDKEKKNKNSDDE